MRVCVVLAGNVVDANPAHGVYLSHGAQLLVGPQHHRLPRAREASAHGLGELLEGDAPVAVPVEGLEERIFVRTAQRPDVRAAEAKGHTSLELLAVHAAAAVLVEDAELADGVLHGIDSRRAAGGERLTHAADGDPHTAARVRLEEHGLELGGGEGAAQVQVVAVEERARNRPRRPLDTQVAEHALEVIRTDAVAVERGGARWEV
mmetsp:Transcript_25103/g.73706  ORF Transcript_25103/g.73706 Transcript_25103/m.73706 type:complete len:205 (+) Transcript_25103:382-996(+)